VEKAVRYLGKEVTVTSDPGKILAADRVILPGVAAWLFAALMEPVFRRYQPEGTGPEEPEEEDV